jgi:hypothetical protein
LCKQSSVDLSRSPLLGSCSGGTFHVWDRLVYGRSKRKVQMPQTAHIAAH